jgi:two-component system OmpR family sensor kinase/two-component system sensor histidine kinase QseC
MAEAAGRRWSLRGRMLGVAAAACVLSWLAGGAAIWIAVQREDSLLFDARLADLAQTLLVFADHELREIRMEGGKTPLHVDTEASAQGRYRYQIWSTDGRLMLSSLNAPTDAPLMLPGQRGWATRSIGGEAMRVFSLEGPGGVHQIQAAAPISKGLVANNLFNGTLVVGMALSALTLGALTLLMLRRTLKPLREAGEQIAQRGPADLSAVALGGLPDELAPVVDATNQVMRRVEVALRSEREFVAAAAHELRTPLSGLRAQAELAAHPRTLDAQRHDALQAVLEGVDHAAHLVNQLLDLARSDVLAGDPATLAQTAERVDLATVFERTLGDVAPQAALQGLRLIPRFGVATLRGSDFGIGLIMRNLVANAVAHAPQGGEVLISSQQSADSDWVLLCVEDSGEGIPTAERESVFERFHRVQGTQRPGCGLGLSIVKTLVDAHRARIVLGDSTLGGLRVEVAFPA